MHKSLPDSPLSCAVPGPAPAVSRSGVTQSHDFAHVAHGFFRETLRFYGDALGLKNFKKHLGWYIEAAPWPHSAEERRRNTLSGSLKNSWEAIKANPAGVATRGALPVHIPGRRPRTGQPCSTGADLAGEAGAHHLALSARLQR